jgi:peroxiredoxin
MAVDRILSLVIRTVLSMTLIAVMACGDSRQSPQPAKAARGKGSDFVLKDLDGRPFSLAEQQGKPVLLIFSSLWCPTCRSETPYYKKLHDTYGQRGLIVANVVIDGQREKVAQFAASQRLPYRVLLDEKGRVAKGYRVVGVPAMILIDRNGAIVSTQYREMSAQLAALFKDS